jgi:hypothetical protein
MQYAELRILRHKKSPKVTFGDFKLNDFTNSYRITIIFPLNVPFVVIT